MNSRYIRQVTLPGFGQEAQDKLAAAHVAVVGAGGLGSPALLYLAAAGVGRISVIDPDDVDLSNLHRQVIHTQPGEGKADSAARAMNALNPEVTVVAHPTKLTQANALELLADADAVLDGADNLPARYVASWACAKLGIPHVWGSILGFEAQMSVFHAGRGPIFEDVFPVPPSDVPSCAVAGVLGPVVGVVGSAMALEAIKVLTGVGQPLTGQLGYFDALTARWEYVPLQATRQPPQRPLLSDAPEASSPAGFTRIIDVRTAEERAQGHIPGDEHISLDELLAAEDGPAGEADGAWDDVLFYCASGVRSATAARRLGGTSLRGGYARWAAGEG